MYAHAPVDAPVDARSCALVDDCGALVDALADTRRVFVVSRVDGRAS